MLNCHSCVQLCVGLWIVACHPLHPWYSLGKILEWVAMPHSPGDLPDPGIELMSLTSPALAGRFFTTSATWEGPWEIINHCYYCFEPLSFGAICYTAIDNWYMCLPEVSLSKSLRHFSLYWAHFRVVSSRRDPVTWAEKNSSYQQAHVITFNHRLSPHTMILKPSHW